MQEKILEDYCYTFVLCLTFLVFMHYQFLAFGKSRSANLLEYPQDLFLSSGFISSLSRRKTSLEHNGEASRITELVGRQSIVPLRFKRANVNGLANKTSDIVKRMTTSKGGRKKQRTLDGNSRS